MKKLYFAEWIYNIANSAVVLISTVLLTLLAVLSFFFTTWFMADRVESVVIRWDSVIINSFVIIILWFFFSIILLKLNIEKIDLHQMEKIVILIIVSLSVFWIVLVQSKPFADGAVICKAVSAFANNDYSLLYKTEYFGKFPFQLNLLFFFEKLLSTVGEDNYIFLQLLNVFSLVVSFHFIFRLSVILFKNKRSPIILLVLFATCFPAMLYCTFIYGTMYGFALSTGAVYCVILYLEKKKIIYIFGAIPLLILAILIKNNYLIVFLALSILLFFECLKDKKILPLVFIPLVLFLVFFAETGIKSYYEKQSGMEVHTGIPSISWIAMGLETGNKGPGWYNGSMFNTYDDANQDTNEAAKKSKEILEGKVDYYKENPKEFAVFLLKKVVSQWAEPTYESLWVSEHPKNNDMHMINLGKIAKSVYYGKLNSLYWGYCNIYQLIIFFTATLFFWYNRKKINIKQSILMIIVIGGFLFHIIWEANSKYILTYYIYILPYAALGIDYSIKHGQQMLQKIQNKRKRKEK